MSSRVHTHIDAATIKSLHRYHITALAAVVWPKIACKVHARIDCCSFGGCWFRCWLAGAVRCVRYFEMCVFMASVFSDDSAQKLLSVASTMLYYVCWPCIQSMSVSCSPLSSKNFSSIQNCVYSIFHFIRFALSITSRCIVWVECATNILYEHTHTHTHRDG